MTDLTHGPTARTAGGACLLLYLITIAAFLAPRNVVADEPTDLRQLTEQTVVEQTMRPFHGKSVKGVDCSTLAGKVMCGYQGWHAAEGDDCGRGWYHWQGRHGFKPGSTNVDLWPDVSELSPEERYATPFKTADGHVAEVYSAFNAKTVLRHFQWMHDYGIDGVFVQRFAGEVFHPLGLRQFNTVLDHCREGANLYGRTYAVMYDLSGLRAGEMGRVMDDWKLLVEKMRITDDPAYLHHNGKPVVAVWGFGFNDGRKYTLREGLELVSFLKSTPAGGCTVMLGVPTYWRTLERDTVNDKMLLELIAKADIVSPWTVGRYGTLKQAADYAAKTLRPDAAWCKANGKDYLPVVFPGFSWHNQNPRSPTNQIPRLGGEFLWSQYVAAKRAGATMVYQAMFDEVDEGTAIYKCTNDVPVGESTFLTYEGLPSDHYLKLVGQATKMLRGDIPPTDAMPRVEATDHADRSSSAPANTNRAQWMQDRLSSLGDKPLKDLVLPASHDSAMYETGFPQSLAQTQDLTIYAQLSAGVRYFDLRPLWDGDTLFIHHGPIKGPKLADVLADVRRFADEGHCELILLKFSHYEGFQDAAYKNLTKQIKTVLGPWLYTSLPRGKRLADVTLSDYVQRSAAVLVLCDGAFPVDNRSEGIWVYRDWDSEHPEQGDLRVFDQYSNTVSYSTMKTDQFAKFNRYDGKCKSRPDVPCDLFLLSWTLTPPTDVRSFAAEANRNLAPALNELKIPNRSGCIVNLIYTDYVDSAKATDIAIAQNAAISPAALGTKKNQ